MTGRDRASESLSLANLNSTFSKDQNRTQDMKTIAQQYKEAFPDLTQLKDAADVSCRDIVRSWDNESTTWIFGDGSRLVVSGTTVETR